MSRATQPLAPEPMHLTTVLHLLCEETCPSEGAAESFGREGNVSHKSNGYSENT